LIKNIGSNHDSYIFIKHLKDNSMDNSIVLLKY